MERFQKKKIHFFNGLTKLTLKKEEGGGGGGGVERDRILEKVLTSNLFVTGRPKSNIQ